MFSHIFRNRPLTQLLRRCKNVAFKNHTGKRWLLSSAFLKMDTFEAMPNDKQWDVIGDEFLREVENLVENNKAHVMLGDLSLLIHVAKTEREFTLVEKLCLRYINGHAYRHILGLGTNVIRMCHHVNDWQLACRFMENQTMKRAGMYSMVCAHLLGDLLYEHGEYDKLLEQAEPWIQREELSAALLFLLYATYLKQNTRESFEKMQELWQEHNIIKLTRSFKNGIYMGVLLALRQNEPQVALHMLQSAPVPVTNRGSLLGSMLLMWAQAEQGNLDEFLDAIDELSLMLKISTNIPIHLRLVRRHAIVLDLDVMNSVKAAISRHEDVQKSEMCLSKIASLEPWVLLLPGSLDKVITKHNWFPKEEPSRPFDRPVDFSDSEVKEYEEEARL